MACNFSQLNRTRSIGRKRHLSEEEQFFRNRDIRARSRSVGKLEAGFSGGRERILKLKQLRQNAQTNYQTITAGMQPEVRKPLRVAFTPLDQSEKLPKPKTVDAQQILEEDEEEEEEDEPEPDDGPDELEEGETWDSKMTFILATIGYAVGLGNIWRFPYLAQKNGGGAFLIPYFIALITLGLPMFILELAIGQRLRKGSIGVWKQISPYLGGLGLASAAVAFNVALYYNTIIAWCLKYLVQSFMSPLPWAECPAMNDTSIPEINRLECQIAGPTAYFWYRDTLEISADLESPDQFNFIVAICLISSWLMLYLAMIKGITESPKVVYITSIFPYLVLVIFFCRAVTLPGMGDGILHLFTPKFSLLLDPMVWLEAGTQIFFSLGLSFGSLIAYSSYNAVDSNCMRDAFIVAITNCFTSIFAAIIIFAILGFKAHKSLEHCLATRAEILEDIGGTESAVEPAESADSMFTWAVVDGDNVTVPICDLQRELDKSASGTGLAFILFTDAVNQFPYSNVWAVLFFCMLFTLGMDSQFGTLQGVIQAVADLKLLKNMKKEYQTGIICLTCCTLSMMFAHSAGSYVFTIYDNFSGNIPLLVIALFQCLGISYVYGLNRFCDDIALMTGHRPNVFLCFCWKYISPAVMVAILAAFFGKMVFGKLTYEAWDVAIGSGVAKEWPWWAYIIIFCLIGMSCIWIPLIAGLKFFGIQLLADEPAGWFPSAELRDDNNIGVHKATKFERLVFGFRDDETEGICFKTSTAPLTNTTTNGGDKTSPQEPGENKKTGEDEKRVVSVLKKEQPNETKDTKNVDLENKEPGKNKPFVKTEEDAPGAKNESLEDAKNENKNVRKGSL